MYNCTINMYKSYINKQYKLKQEPFGLILKIQAN